MEFGAPGAWPVRTKKSIKKVRSVCPAFLRWMRPSVSPADSSISLIAWQRVVVPVQVIAPATSDAAVMVAVAPETPAHLMATAVVVVAGAVAAEINRLLVISPAAARSAMPRICHRIKHAPALLLGIDKE